MSFLYNEKIRALLIQIAVFVAVVAVIWWLGHNALQNLAKNHISTGFGFLHETAGFKIIQTLIPYSEQSSYGRAFLVSLLNTLLVGGLGIILASVLGLLLGIGRLSNNWLIARLCGGYVEIFRNLPLLLQLFFWYFAVLRALPHPRQSLDLGGAIYLNNRGLYMPDIHLNGSFWLILAAALLAGTGLWGWRWLARRRAADDVSAEPGWFGYAPWPARSTMIAGALLAAGLVAVPVLLTGGVPVEFSLPRQTRFNLTSGMKLIPEFLALLLALSLYTAAFIGEIVRAGLQSVARGQREAALALGLPQGLILRRVILPQALRVIIPPLTSQYLNLVKNSSLAVAIAYPDLVSVFAGTVLNHVGQAIEIVLMVMAVYLTISLVTALFMNWFNARMALPER